MKWRVEYEQVVSNDQVRHCCWQNWVCRYLQYLMVGKLQSSHQLFEGVFHHSLHLTLTPIAHRQKIELHLILMYLAQNQNDHLLDLQMMRSGDGVHCVAVDEDVAGSEKLQQ